MSLHQRIVCVTKSHVSKLVNEFFKVISFFIKVSEAVFARPVAAILVSACFLSFIFSWLVVAGVILAVAIFVVVKLVLYFGGILFLTFEVLICQLQLFFVLLLSLTQFVRGFFLNLFQFVSVLLIDFALNSFVIGVLSLVFCLVLRGAFGASVAFAVHFIKFALGAVVLFCFIVASRT